MAEGDLRWRYDSGTQISSGIVVGSDGVIYFGNRYDGLFALNSDGTLKWKYSPTNARVDSGGALSNDESVVYFGGDNGQIYAIYTATGIAKWVYDVPPASSGYIYSGIVVDVNDNIYYGPGGGRAVSLTPAGNLRWSVDLTELLPDSDESYAGMLIVGNYVYSATFKGLFKYALADGAEIWQHAPPNGAQGTGISVGADGTIYYGCTNFFYAVNPLDGSEKWSYPVSNYGCTANAVGSNGNIWFVDCSGANTKLIVLDPDGNLVWDYALPDWVGSGVDTTGLALDSNDIAYVGCDDNKLYVIDSDGTLRWTYTAGNDVESGIAFSPSPHTVYFGSDDGYLYAVEKLGPPDDVRRCGNNLSLSIANRNIMDIGGG